MSASKALTPLQSAVLDYCRQHPRAPTCREIADHFGWHSGNAAATHLQALEKAGCVRRVPGRHVELLAPEPAPQGGPPHG